MIVSCERCLAFRQNTTREELLSDGWVYIETDVPYDEGWRCPECARRQREIARLEEES